MVTEVASPTAMTAYHRDKSAGLPIYWVFTSDKVLAVVRFDGHSIDGPVKQDILLPTCFPAHP